jgi:hypothetical protein
MTVEARFRVFMRVFMLDTLISVQHADLVVELDRLGAADYRGQTAEQLREMCGLPDLCFDDWKLPEHVWGNDADYPALMREAGAFLDDFSRYPEARPLERAIGFLRSRLA